MTDRELISSTKTKILEWLAAADKPGATIGRAFDDLLSACGLTHGRRTVHGRCEPRILDRALQELRKDGLIRHEKRQWQLNTAAGRGAHVP